MTLTYFNQAGEALLSDATTLQGMSNYRPFASLANSALPAGSTDVYLRAQSSSERVTGVGFVFNSANEPSIANAVGLNPAKSFDRLLLPWVSKNAQFESIVNINNLGTTPLSVNLTATRGNGETMTVTELITSQGFMNRTAGSLFAGLGDGSGFSVMIQAENGGKLNAQANVVTYNLTTASKTSPSFGNAVAYTQSGPSPNPEDAFGKAICFGFLPVTNDLISSPVIVNLSQAAANVTLYFFDETGQLVLKDDQTLQNLAPLQPFAAVANNLIPAGSNDVYLVAVSDQPITGLSFVFNTSAEPSIGNVSRVDFTPPN